MIRLTAGAVLAMALLATPAVAGNGAAAAGADALFREAVQLAESGNFAEAAAKFKASYQLDPARGTLQGWAMAEEGAGQPELAYKHYQQLLAEAKAANDERRAKLAQGRMHALGPKLALVTLVVNGPPQPDGAITLDGAIVPPEDLGKPIPVKPGMHTVRGSSPSGAAFARSATAELGQSTRLELRWQPLEESQAPGASPAASEPTTSEPMADAGGSNSLTTAGLIVGGAGVVLAGVGTYLWIDSGKDFDNLQNDCPNHQCPPDSQSRIDDGRSKESLARVLLIGGTLATATGITLFVIGNQEEKEPQARAVVGPTGAYLTGRF